MAIMYPSSLPTSFIETDRGEAKVFQCLKEQLSDEWIVYHSVYWSGKPTGYHRRRNGETDFIITHPTYGIVVVEVKGGVFIQYNQEDDLWISTDQHLQAHDLTNPFDQALRNYYALIDVIVRLNSKTLHANLVKSSIPMAHCVIFSDVTRVSGNLPINYDKELILYQQDLNLIERRLIAILDFFFESQYRNTQLTKDIVKQLQKAYAPTFVLDRQLSTWIEDEQKRMLQLTEEQYQILDICRQLNQASIYGCAGSGKTLLAIKKAIMCAESEQRTALICFNSILGNKFRKHAQGIEDLMAGNLHQLLLTYLPEGSQEEMLFDDMAMLDTVMNLEIEKFDAIIVDEAQDFTEEQLDIIHYLLKKDGLIYYFWDDNQRIIRTSLHIPNNVPILTLSTNLRNTQYIFDYVKSHYLKPMDIKHKGPLGREVTFTQPYAEQNQTACFSLLRKEIQKLVVNEQMSPEDITILTFKSKSKSWLNQFSLPNTSLSYFEDEVLANHIRIETVRRFKGMESKVVIVTEMNDERCLQDETLFHEMCYVSFSRATNHLIVIPNQYSLEKLKD